MDPNRIGTPRRLAQIAIIVSILGLLCSALALAVRADHPPISDGGFDLAWSEPMNQETFWESYFGDGYDCTKFSNHSGSIPSSYEAAVVKSGSDFVRVYTDPPTQVLGPPNPNAQHPNRRHEAPFSWVMKCDYSKTTTTTVNEETTTSATDTTTTTEPEVSSTTTTPVDTSTTTSLSTSSTTTDGSSTTLHAPTTSVPTDGSTTMPSPSPSSSMAGGNDSPSPSRPTELPFTGPEQLLPLGLVATGLVGGGWRLIRGRWGR